VSLLACASAYAQPQPSGGPFTGLFRGSPKDQPHHLDLNGSAFGAWDDNVLAQLPNTQGNNATGLGLLPQTVKPGIATGFQVGLNYGFQRSGTRSGVNVSAAGNFQEFESSSGNDRLQFQNYAAYGSLRENLTNKMSMTFGAGSAYAPYYQYAPFLAGTTTTDSPVGSDYGFAVDSEWVRSSNASVSFDDKVTKRSTFSISTGWQQQFITTTGQKIETESVGMRLSHSLTKKLSVYGGYTLQQTQDSLALSGTEPFRYGNVEMGLGYGDGLVLTFARYYTLSMNVGLTAAKNGDPASIAKTGRATQFMVTGGATLSRAIGRTWSASIGYARGVNYVVGFQEPLNTDSATAGIRGPIVPRVFFSLGAGATRGQQVFTGGGKLIAYDGSARLTYGIFGNVGLYAQASYYKFSVPPDALEAFTFTPQLQRRSVSAGITTWLPLIKPPRARRTPIDQQAGQQ
jgi:hypothetical protein